MNAHDTITSMLDTPDLLKGVIKIARGAGGILNDYQKNQNFFLTIKPDESPLTTADLESSDHIKQQLNNITPGITVMSEENKQVPENESVFWAVDPLDGTKNFISGEAEFSVNIALIINGHPALGVVHCPLSNTTYFTQQNEPSFKQLNRPRAEKQRTWTREYNPEEKLKVAFNSAHADPKTYKKARELLSKRYNLNIPEAPIPDASAKSIMLVAEGVYDMLIKTGRDKTLQGSGGYAWDNAAPHIILANAGGGIADLYNGYAGFKPYDDVGRDRMHAFAAIGDRQLRDSLFKQHPLRLTK